MDWYNTNFTHCNNINCKKTSSVNNILQMSKRAVITHDNLDYVHQMIQEDQYHNTLRLIQANCDHVSNLSKQAKSQTTL